MPGLRKPVKGETVAASDIAAIIGVIEGLIGGQAGGGAPGLASARGAGAVWLALAKLIRRFGFVCTITKVTTDGAESQNIASTPSKTLYDGTAIYGEFEFKDKPVDLGRWVRGDQWAIWPARVGDKCVVLRVPDAEGVIGSLLWILTEAIPPLDCEPPPGGSPDGLDPAIVSPFEGARGSGAGTGSGPPGGGGGAGAPGGGLGGGGPGGGV